MILILLISILTICSTFDPLINQQSSLQVKQLYSYLISVNGKYVLSGQTNSYYNQLVNKVKKNPLIRGFDMQNYSPHNPWYNWQPYDDGTVFTAIQWYHNTNSKGIVSFHWHWFSPMGGNLRTSTFYTDQTDFNLTKAVTPGTQQYTATIRDIDAIAVQLKRLQSQRIPVIWRPLHQAGGKWFWWGSKTNVQTLKLYSILQQRLINYHKINNLIWTWSTPQSNWYPGNQKVDMIGFDSYPGIKNYTCNSDKYYTLKNIVGNNKMIHMTQNGPIPEWQQCWQNNIKWGYFLSWSDLVVAQNDDNHLWTIYNSNPLVKTVQNR